MSKINHLIGQANFQIVEIQLAAILQDEFIKQNELQEIQSPGSSFLPETVYFGFTRVVNEGDLPFVAVNWTQERGVLESGESLHYSDSYFIDVKAVSRTVCAKIINAVRHILKSNYYRSLDLPSGMISRTGIDNLGIDFEVKTTGAQGTESGGINFGVDINENVQLLEGLPISELLTKCNIGDNTIEFKKII
jgi:hypothetical protein